MKDLTYMHSMCLSTASNTISKYSPCITTQQVSVYTPYEQAVDQL